MQDEGAALMGMGGLVREGKGEGREGREGGRTAKADWEGPSMRIFHLWMSDSSSRLTFMPSGGEMVMSASSWMGGFSKRVWKKHDEML